jgi:hypothetical protein
MLLNFDFMVSVTEVDCVEKLTIVGILPPTEWRDTNVSEVWISRQCFWDSEVMERMVLGIDAGTWRAIVKVRSPLSLHLTVTNTDRCRRISQGVWNFLKSSTYFSTTYRKQTKKKTFI